MVGGEKELKTTLLKFRGGGRIVVPLTKIGNMLGVGGGEQVYGNR